MKNKQIPPICLITNTDNDSRLIQDFADIERQVQPLDHWDAKTIAEMLSQDIYECWGIMKIDSSEDTKAEEDGTLKEGIDKQEVRKHEIDKHEIGKQEGGNDKKIASYAEILNENDFSIVAYCLFSKVYEVVEILRIGTHPDFQRRGYAQCLLKLFIKAMSRKGLERVLLEVREDNIAAIALYCKMGFEVIHTRKNYYDTPAAEGKPAAKCNALIMQYKLTDAAENTNN